MMQTQEVIVPGVKFDMPEGAFDVNFVYLTTPAQCSDPLCNMVNSGELKGKGGTQVDIFCTTCIDRPTLGETKINYNSSIG